MTWVCVQIWAQSFLRVVRVVSLGAVRVLCSVLGLTGSCWFFALRWPQQILQLLCTDGHLFWDEPPLQVFQSTEKDDSESLGKCAGDRHQRVKTMVGCFDSGVTWLPLVHVTTLKELGGLGIMQESIPALFLSLRQRAQDVSGGHSAGLALYFLQAILCKRKKWLFTNVTRRHHYRTVVMQSLRGDQADT